MALLKRVEGEVKREGLEVARIVFSMNVIFIHCTSFRAHTRLSWINIAKRL
jgi:hypothetical protein